VICAPAVVSAADNVTFDNIIIDMADIDYATSDFMYMDGVTVTYIDNDGLIKKLDLVMDRALYHENIEALRSKDSVDSQSTN
jgi:hypothetical protein